jgi:hypothetical protein
VAQIIQTLPILPLLASQIVEALFGLSSIRTWAHPGLLCHTVSLTEGSVTAGVSLG